MALCNSAFSSWREFLWGNFYYIIKYIHWLYNWSLKTNSQLSSRYGCVFFFRPFFPQWWQKTCLDQLLLLCQYKLSNNLVPFPTGASYQWKMLYLQKHLSLAPQQPHQITCIMPNPSILITLTKKLHFSSLLPPVLPPVFNQRRATVSPVTLRATNWLNSTHITYYGQADCM